VITTPLAPPIWQPTGWKYGGVTTQGTWLGLGRLWSLLRYRETTRS